MLVFFFTGNYSSGSGTFAAGGDQLNSSMCALSVFPTFERIVYIPCLINIPGC